MNLLSQENSTVDSEWILLQVINEQDKRCCRNKHNKNSLKLIERYLLTVKIIFSYLRTRHGHTLACAYNHIQI